MVHVLLHMARHDHPVISERIAEMLDANPAFVRRTMAGLRDAGYVASEKGHHGGWRLVRGLDEIRLLDVYRALGNPTILAMGLAEDRPGCLIEQAVNDALKDAFRDAEAALMAKLGEVTLADLDKAFENGLRTLGEERRLCLDVA
jgi:Rrf2 family protein